VVLGLTLVYTGAVVSANLLADLVLLQLDPRRRA
jgi:ABC-type dipeptide/oligopeptide/nickel transport system permease component